MTDTTHNSLVTLMIIIGVLIAILLLGRFFGGSTYGYSYYRQPASAIDFYRHVSPEPTVSQSSVTAYSRPSTYYPTQYDSSSYNYQHTYSYSCDGMGNCWTNQ
jgi:hypothetical protein